MFPVSDGRTVTPPAVAPAPRRVFPIAESADCDPKHRAVRCSTCSMQRVCMPSGLSPDEFERLDAIICSTRTVRRGEALYRCGDAFQCLYAVRSGEYHGGNRPPVGNRRHRLQSYRANRPSPPNYPTVM